MRLLAQYEVLTMQVLSGVQGKPSSWEVTEADAELMYAHVLPSLARFFSLQVAAEAKWPSGPAPASVPCRGRLVCIAAAPHRVSIACFHALHPKSVYAR